jgi:GcrA cell cycle regulator
MWPQARVEALTRAWRDGLSASQIATHMGGGLTRSAVIGKLHRLGLCGGRKPSAPRRALAPPPPAPSRPEPAVLRLRWPDTPQDVPTQTKPGQDRSTQDMPLSDSPPIAAANGAPPVGPGPKYLRDMNARECRFGLGDPGVGAGALQLFCAAPTTGHAYCAHHRAIAILPPRSLAEQRVIKSEMEALVRSVAAGPRAGRGEGRGAR